MTHRSRLRFASLLFAVLWTGAMAWWASPLMPNEIVTLAIGGVLAGLAWHWLYGRWYRWHFARNVFPRRRVR